MNKKESPTEWLSQIEQGEALMRDFAPLVASYYQSLVKNGVPEKLAHELTLAWHEIWWRNSFGER